jgi:large subunit ribosomal protein L19
MNKMQMVEDLYVRKDIPKFGVGDTVRLKVKLPDSPEKTRLHPFEGVVISRHGSGTKESFTVRKVSYGEGIERVFCLNSPAIESIEVLRSGKVKRAKLYYLRSKVGKRATKIESREEKKQQ